MSARLHIIAVHPRRGPRIVEPISRLLFPAVIHVFDVERAAEHIVSTIPLPIDQTRRWDWLRRGHVLYVSGKVAENREADVDE